MRETSTSPATVLSSWGGSWQCTTMTSHAPSYHGYRFGTVKLTNNQLTDPQDIGLVPVVKAPCWASDRAAERLTSA